MIAACLLQLLLWTATAGWAAAELQAHVLDLRGFSVNGVALDGAGRVFCSDYYGDRIAVFNSSTGALLSFLNASNTLVAPSGLAWDPVYGGLIVSNTNEFAWLRLSADGQQLPLFPLNHSLSSPWTSNEWPGGVAVDGTTGALVFGYYWSGDVAKYAADGTLLWQQYASECGNADNSSCSAYTRGLTVDAAGDVWAADWFGSRIIHFSSDGQRLAVLYSPGQLQGAWGLAFDAAGALVVASFFNNRVLRFDVSGGELGLLQVFNTSDPGLNSPAGLAIDSSGNVWCGDTGNGRVVTLAPSGVLELQLVDGTSVELTALSLVYVPATDNLIVAIYGQLWFVALNGSVGAQLIFDPPLLVDKPCGLAVAASGAVLLASPYTNQLLQLQLDLQAGANSSWSVFTSSPTIDLTDRSPAVAVDAAGNVYLSNSASNEVLMMSEAAAVQAVFTTSDPPLQSPAGVAVLPDGSLLYTADTSNDRVVRWTTAVSSTAPSQVWTGINQPVGLVVDPLGNVFASSSGSFYQLLPDGNVTVACGPVPSPGSQPINDSYDTTFLTVDRSGSLYLADWYNNRIVVCPAAAPAPIPSSSSTAPPVLTSSSPFTSSSSTAPPTVISSSPSVSSASSTGTSSSSLIAFTSSSSLVASFTSSSSPDATFSPSASVASSSSLSASLPSYSFSLSSPTATVSSSSAAASSSSSASSSALRSSSPTSAGSSSSSSFPSSSSFSSQASGTNTAQSTVAAVESSSSSAASSLPATPAVSSSGAIPTSQHVPATSAAPSSGSADSSRSSSGSSESSGSGGSGGSSGNGSGSSSNGSSGSGSSSSSGGSSSSSSSGSVGNSGSSGSSSSGGSSGSGSSSNSGSSSGSIVSSAAVAMFSASTSAASSVSASFSTSSPPLAALPASSGGGLPVGAIIGIAVGAGALACCLLLCAAYRWSSRRQKQPAVSNGAVEVVSYATMTPSAADHSPDAAAAADAAERPSFSYDSLRTSSRPITSTASASTIRRSQIVFVY